MDRRLVDDDLWVDVGAAHRARDVREDDAVADDRVEDVAFLFAEESFECPGGGADLFERAFAFAVFLPVAVTEDPDTVLTCDVSALDFEAEDSGRADEHEIDLGPD